MLLVFRSDFEHIQKWGQGVLSATRTQLRSVEHVISGIVGVPRESTIEKYANG